MVPATVRAVMIRRRFLPVVLAACLVGCSVGSEGDRVERGAPPPWDLDVTVGEALPFLLPTHCGINWIELYGARWHAEGPLTTQPTAKGDGWDEPLHEGWMTIVDGSTAVFTGGPEAVVFNRVSTDAQPFGCY